MDEQAVGPPPTSRLAVLAHPQLLCPPARHGLARRQGQGGVWARGGEAAQGSVANDTWPGALAVAN